MAYKNPGNTEFKKLHDSDFQNYMKSRLDLYFDNYDSDCPSPPYPESIDLNSPSSINLLKEWYLIQQDASHVMLIINRNDLLLTTTTKDLTTIEIQNYSKIKYQKNNQITYGRVLNQSDDRDLLEQELRKRLTNIVKNNSILREGILKEKENSETLTTTTTPNATATLSSLSPSPSTSKQSRNYCQKFKKKILNFWFLIQYERDENCIIHSIININQFWWDLNDTKKSINQDLFIMDNDIKRKVIVLLASKNRNDIIKELELLSSVSFNLAYDNPEISKVLTMVWLLVQTTKDNMEMVYTIINEAKTIRKHENLYPDVVTYIKDDQKNVLYQAVILKKSVRRNQLEQALDSIRTNSICMLYPLDQEKLISNTFYRIERKTYSKRLNVDYLTFSRATQTDIEYPDDGEINVDVGTEVKDMDDETAEEYYPETELDLLKQISWMEETMYNESNTLRDAFYQIDRIGSGLDREINTLEYLLSLPDMF